MKTLYSKPLKDEKLQLIKARVQKLKEANINPKLTAVIVGNDPASEIYVGHKVKVCNQLGILSDVIKLPEDSTWEILKENIEKLNNDMSVHGILVQLPLPKHLSGHVVGSIISPIKDCDGANPMNVGLVYGKYPAYAPKPCTPYGIIELLKHYNISLEGKKATIIGRSNIVGKPLLGLMIDEHATVSVVNTRTPKKVLDKLLLSSDIIVSAAGARGIVTPENVKKGAVLIDVGIHRLESGKLVGDIDIGSFKDIASAGTPVPGGVGPMTITMLMENLIRLIEENKDK